MPLANHVGAVAHALQLLGDHGVVQVRALESPEAREVGLRGLELEGEVVVSLHQCDEGLTLKSLNAHDVKVDTAQPGCGGPREAMLSKKRLAERQRRAGP